MAKKKRLVYAVVGAGHGGTAMAGHLALKGAPVFLFNRTAERLTAIQEQKGIFLEGELEGFGRLQSASSDPAEIIPEADVILVALPATAHRWAAEICAPYLRDGQMVILNPGRTFGALEFLMVLKAKKVTADVCVGEAQTFIYASRRSGPASARVFAIKNAVPLACIPAFKTPAVVRSLSEMLPNFMCAGNILETSFNNIGSVFHPALMVMNAGWIEDESNFEFYMQGGSESVCNVLERVDAERVAVGQALGINVMSARHWLYFAYDAAGKNLYQAMRANPGYRGILAPNRLNMRYLTEDCPCSLVPIASAGRQYGVETPTIRAIVHLAEALTGLDFVSEGRTVARLGLKGMSLRDLRLVAIGEREPEARSE
jgi:opine dehydrogenase